MKNKMLARRIAIAMLSAGMVVSTVPVSTFAAAQSVSIEASDAATNVAGLSDSIPEADQTTIKNALAAATTTAKSTDTAKGHAFTVSVSTVGNYTIENYKILSSTAPSVKETASGFVFVKPMLHMQADIKLTAGGAAKGTVTFDIEAADMTKTEKIAALKTILATVGGSSSDATTYSNDDNSTSLLSNVNGIIDSVKDTSGYSLAHGTVFSGILYNATQESITKATKSASGSESVKVDIKATLAKASDPDWDDAWGTNMADTHDVTDSVSYTATIPKLATEGKDDAYQAKVTAALKDATITNTEYNSDPDDSTDHSDAEAKIRKALEAVGIADSDAGDVTVTFRNFKKATHAADGSVEVLVDDTSRNGSTAVQYATVTIPVTHKDDVVEIEKEVQGVLSKVEKAIAADSKDVSSTKSGKDDQLKDLKANIQKKVDEALAATDGGNSYASEIKKVEVSLDKDIYAAAGKTAGSIPANGLIFTVTYNDTVSAATYDTTKGIAGTPSSPADAKIAYKNIDAIAVYKINEVTATAMTLPETSYVQTSSTGTTITPKFTPADTNSYTVRWDLKDTKTVIFANDQITKASVGASGVTLSSDSDDKVTDDNATSKTEVFTQNAGVKVVPVSTAKAGDSVELTASLLDKEGLVVATVKTKVTLLKGFADVQNTHDYAYKAITYLSDPQIVIKNGKAEKVAVINGTSDTTFTPDADVTRAQFVTFLYRLAQQDADKVTATEDNVSDTVADADLKKDNAYQKFASFTDSKASTKFTDVDANAYYAKAVDWAVANGITSGKTDTTFAPNAKVTRAEAVTFLYRYFAANQSYNAADFTDVANTAYYANAVGWASSNGVTQGKTAKTFAPNDTTTRKEAAAFIYRATNTAKINK